MKYQDNFKFLNVQLMKRKKTEENKNVSDLALELLKEYDFLVLNLLDCDNNPCRFFVFNEDLYKKIIQSSYLGLQDVVIAFEVIFVNNNWNVRILDIA